jgi:hypothetical protein
MEYDVCGNGDDDCIVCLRVEINIISDGTNKYVRGV